MADIVAAAATSHVLMSSRGVEDRADRVFKGMMAIGRSLRAAKPDVILMIGNDHQFNLDLSVKAPFLIGTGETLMPFGEMDIPREPFPGKPDFARGLISHAKTQGIAITGLENLQPDHGVAIPMLFANPDHNIPVVPLLVNLAVETAPTPTRCWQLGEIIRSYIQTIRPLAERVAIVATGGLSHWVGYEGRSINEKFDHRFLADWESGKIRGWAEKSPADIEREAGNGGLEISNWLMMAAAVPGAKSQTIYYEPMPEWMTGMGGILMQLASE